MMTSQIARKTRQEAERQYTEVRKVTCIELEDDFSTALGPGFDVRLSDLTREDAAEADAWVEDFPIERRPAWSWISELRRFRQHRPRRFELAIRESGELCGVALGRISDRRVVISVHYVASKPTNNSLEGVVLDLTLRYVEYLGRKLGCVEVSLESPVEGLIERYRSLGFTREFKRGKRVVRMRKCLQ